MGQNIKLEQYTLYIQRQLLKKRQLEFLGILATSMAHNLNNIFASIITCTELLQMTSGDTPNVSSCSETITKTTMRGAEIVNLLSSASKLFQATDESVCRNTKNIVSTIVKLFQDLDHKKISYHTHIQEKLPALAISASDLSSVIFELFKNASASMQTDGTTTISAEMETNKDSNITFAKFSIADTGCGISEHQFSKLVQFMLPNSTNAILDTTLDDLGLGLMLCHNIITNAGGRFEIAKTSSNGTEIEFRVPIVP